MRSFSSNFRLRISSELIEITHVFERMSHSDTDPVRRKQNSKILDSGRGEKLLTPSWWRFYVQRENLSSNTIFKLGHETSRPEGRLTLTKKFVWPFQRTLSTFPKCFPSIYLYLFVFTLQTMESSVSQALFHFSFSIFFSSYVFFIIFSSFVFFFRSHSDSQMKTQQHLLIKISRELFFAQSFRTRPSIFFFLQSHQNRKSINSPWRKRRNTEHLKSFSRLHFSRVAFFHLRHFKSLFNPWI